MWKASSPFHSSILDRSMSRTSRGRSTRGAGPRMHHRERRPALRDRPASPLSPSSLSQIWAASRNRDISPTAMTEEIITLLSSVPDLFVIARNSTYAYKGLAVDVRKVAQDLGVRYVLEGSVRRAGD